ncbi:MAG: Stk1 family PASTA domain-containing Ser/Thr kinase [Actinomycetota bacterium]
MVRNLDPDPAILSGVMPSVPGRDSRLLGGRYSVVRKLASGGMAEVYEARDTVLDRSVAIKMLHANYSADSEFVERFRKEAMAAGRLNHPNIVQVYDWGRSDEGEAFMVMELVEGTTLREMLQERGMLAPVVAARIAEQVCAALDLARRSGIVHRDIKPENILITAEGRAKVADFGVARALAESRVTQAGMVLGTAAYLAPEQVEGHAGDHRADLYSLGTCLFEMLTGRPPFGGDNPVVVAYRRVAEDVPNLTRTTTGIPEELSRIVERATARAPEDRFASAAEMGKALGALTQTDAEELELGGTTVMPIGVAETQVIRRRVPRKRRRVKRALIVFVALAVIAAVVPLGFRFLSKVPVPNVQGRAQSAAQRTLEKAGFHVEPAFINDPVVAQGLVIGTIPRASAKARRGSKVILSVSLGPKIATVPTVIALTEAHAVAQLSARHLRVVKHAAFSATVKAGLVIDQHPDPNVAVKEGTPVTITVSKGVEQRTVPSVNGKTLDEARSALESAGFSVAIKRALNETVSKGSVISSKPGEGRKAPKGSTVTLIVSDGPTKAVVPDVTGRPYDEGARIIKDAGLRAQRHQVRGSSGDTIVSEYPQAGTKQPRGTTIVLYTA